MRAIGRICFVGLALFLGTSPAQALEVSLFSDPPQLSEDGKTVDLLVGARLAGIERVKLDDLSVSFGKKPGKVVSSAPYLDFAAEKSKAAESWRPPITVGLIYLWTESAPPEMLDGVHRLFKRLPPQTVVLPTPFGQSYFPVVNPVTAARVAGGGIDDQPFIEGDAITFLAAARANVAEVAKDDAPLKAIVIIADGRDYTANTDPGPFAAFGKQLRDAGYITQVIGLPTDDDSAKANVRALAHSAGARLLPARQGSELPALTEAAGTLFFDLRVLKVAVPFSTGLFGGEVEVTLQATAEGKRISVSAGKLTIPASGGMVVLLVGLVLIVAGGIGAFLVMGKKRGSSSQNGESDEEEMEGFLDAIQELVRRRVDPNRAAVELSRWYPDLVAELPNIDVASLDGDQYRLLKSRAGQARIKEFAKAVGTPEDNAQAPSDDLIGILTSAFSQSLSAPDTARQIRARLPDKRWASFARSRFDEITALLRTAAATQPALGSPKARAFVLSIQDALRQSDGAEVVVGWLVRAAGPGQRGETLRLARPRCVVGTASTCQLRIEDKYLVAEHLAIAEKNGSFSVEPLQGQFKVEGKGVTNQRPLVDGETLEFGQGQFVFKAVLDG